MNNYMQQMPKQDLHWEIPCSRKDKQLKQEREQIGRSSQQHPVIPTTEV